MLLRSGRFDGKRIPKCLRADTNRLSATLIVNRHLTLSRALDRAFKLHGALKSVLDIEALSAWLHKTLKNLTSTHELDPSNAEIVLALALIACKNASHERYVAVFERKTSANSM